MILTRDNEFSAVLDACVLAPMPICDTLLRCAEEPALYRPLWSDQILEEVDRTMLKFGYTDLQAKRRVSFMRKAFPEACVAVPAGLVDGIKNLPDPSDRHVVAVAIREQGNVIVTANLKHFPSEILAGYGIQVCSPDDFLVHQHHLDPEGVYEALDAQASATGQSVLQLLAKLRLAVPHFADLHLTKAKVKRISG